MAKADLIERLCAENVPFATIVAPAGYGKTTLLAQWAEADTRPFAWVALDGRDDGDASCSCGTSRPRSTVSSLSHPTSSTRCPAHAHRTGRCAFRVSGERWPRSSARSCSCWTICTPSRSSCLDVLTALFQYVPPGSQIAVASRAEPALPLARWRAQGSVYEIGVADLRLNELEADLVLKAAGLELDPSEISELTDQTEGWPAGLYLAALSMQAGAPSPADAEGFKGDDRFVSEYFRLELLPGCRRPRPSS